MIWKDSEVVCEYFPSAFSFKISDVMRILIYPDAFLKDVSNQNDNKAWQTTFVQSTLSRKRISLKKS